MRDLDRKVESIIEKFETDVLEKLDLEGLVIPSISIRELMIDIKTLVTEAEIEIKQGGKTKVATKILRDYNLEKKDEKKVRKFIAINNLAKAAKKL